MYQNHRARYLELLAQEGAAALIPTGSLKTRNHDCEYRFRPESDFWWLTGFAEPEAYLVLTPGSKHGDSHLFLQEKDREKETWTGIRLGSEAAPSALGVDHAYDVSQMWQKLPELLAGQRRIVYRYGLDEARDRRVHQLESDLVSRARSGLAAPAEWVAPWPNLHELRLKKSEDELAAMRRAADITAEAHVAAMGETAPGKNEAEIEALVDYCFRRRGSTGAAYNSIVAGGANACVLHYIENNQALSDGELLLIDAGAEWQYYAADVTRTFPIGGQFNAEQRALYELVLAAQKASIDAVRPGRTFIEAHDVSVRVLTEGMIDLGLLSGGVEEAIESGSYRQFYMHKTGHWLGLDVHDCGAYHLEGEWRALEPGMVTTIEPGLYVAPDDESVDARWRGIGVRIEDDILVTENGNENLTSAVPKEIDEVEAACRQTSLVSVG